MSGAGSSQWPPPPDLESIRELVRNADVEGFIKGGAPADEYDLEAEELYMALSELRAEEITIERQLLVLDAIWRRNFTDDDAEFSLRGPALQHLAEQIVRFFGSAAKPSVRS